MTTRRKRERRKVGRPELRNIIVHGVRHDPPDLRKLTKVLLSLASSAEREEDTARDDEAA